MTTNKDYIPKTGDSCQHAVCDGWLVVVRSERLEQAGVVMRDFGCWKCKRRSVPSRPSAVRFVSLAGRTAFIWSDKFAQRQS